MTVADAIVDRVTGHLIPIAEAYQAEKRRGIVLMQVVKALSDEVAELKARQHLEGPRDA